MYTSADPNITSSDMLLNAQLPAAKIPTSTNLLASTK